MMWLAIIMAWVCLGLVVALVFPVMRRACDDNDEVRVLALWIVIADARGKGK